MKVPKGWKVKSLGGLTAWKSGGTPSKNNPEFWNGNIPWISASSMHCYDFFYSDLRITEKGLKSGSKLAKKGSLLLLVRGSMLWKKVPIGIASVDVAFNQDVKALEVNNEIIPEYLLYWFLSHENVLLHKVVGTGMGAGKLDTDMMKSILVSYPPISEQKAIADTLVTWDQVIEKTEKLIELKEKRFKWLLNELIPKKAKKEGWKEVRLGDICEIKKGNGLSKEDTSIDGSNKCILYGELYTTYPQIINIVVSKTNIREGVLSKSGDILVPGSTTTTGIDLANATALLENDILLGGDINILRPKKVNIYDPIFLAYYLTFNKKHEIASFAQGITIVHLYGKDLLKISILLPKLSFQKTVKDIFIISQEEIDNLKTQIEKYKTQKQGLMQKLLTGKWRVKVK
ncbi:MAG: restriction endonuclease subunit S [Candidatus Delongbacteria bacterium]|jgi:type I restriction enzyme S subunit|nr:restriction endonuclease subunit S [Candidatus Delongbacteria bacterium]